MTDRSPAYCPDCQKLASSKTYSLRGSGLSNPQIKCEHCGKKGGMIAPPEEFSDNLIDDMLENSNSATDETVSNTEPQVTETPTETEIEKVPEVQGAKVNVEKLLNKAVTVTKTKDDKPKAIQIKIDKELITELYEGAREFAVAQEKRFTESDEAPIYESRFVKAIMSITSSVISDVTKQIHDFPVKPFVLISNVVLAVPLMFMSLSNVRRRRKGEEKAVNPTEQELSQYT